MNYIYDELRQENKINEIVLERHKRSLSRDPSLSSLHKQDTNNNNINKEKDKASSSPLANTNSPTKLKSSKHSYKDLLYNPNRMIVFAVKDDNPNEKFLIAKKYINLLSQSEFYMI